MTEFSPDFPAAYRRFLAPVRLKCRRLLGDAGEAEEAAHECFVRLLRARPGSSPEGDPAAVMGWLYRTCTRLCVDILRRRKIVAPAPAHDALDQAPLLPGVDRPEDALAARQLVARMSAQVPDDELQAAVLCRVDGLSQPEASTILGVSDRTVRRLLERFDQRTEQLRKEFAS